MVDRVVDCGSLQGLMVGGQVCKIDFHFLKNKMSTKHHCAFLDLICWCNRFHFPQTLTKIYLSTCTELPLTAYLAQEGTIAHYGFHKDYALEAVLCGFVQVTLLCLLLHSKFACLHSMLGRESFPCCH